MKKMNRDTEPIVFRSFSTPGLHTQRESKLEQAGFSGARVTSQMAIFVIHFLWNKWLFCSHCSHWAMFLYYNKPWFSGAFKTSLTCISADFFYLIMDKMNAQICFMLWQERSDKIWQPHVDFTLTGCLVCCSQVLIFFYKHIHMHPASHVWVRIKGITYWGRSRRKVHLTINFSKLLFRTLSFKHLKLKYKWGRDDVLLYILDCGYLRKPM